ncbi:DMT family transporter [Chloroflexota bacterium]
MVGKTLTLSRATPLMQRGGILIVITAAVLFSSLIIFVRHITGLNALSITFYRFTFAFLLLCATLLWDRSPLLHWRDYKQYTPLLILLGLVMVFCAIFYAFAIRHIPAAAAALLVNTSPIFVAIFSPFVLKEVRPRFTWISLAVATVGLVLVTGLLEIGIDQIDLMGVVAAMGAGLLYTIPLFIGRKLKGQVNPRIQALFGMGMGALLLLPFAISTLPVAVPQMGLLIPMGILSLGIPYLLIFVSLNHVSAQTASVGMLGEPVSGVLIGFLIFGEALTVAGWIGCALILGAIALISVE